jgi:hypothetical protein
MTESTSVTLGRIFISYRREETAYPAGWLFDRLVHHFDGQIFKDVDSIQPVDDFVDVITTAVASCDVLLALIGVDWLLLTHRRIRSARPHRRSAIAWAFWQVKSGDSESPSLTTGR